jgi:hypothetical protein
MIQAATLLKNEVAVAEDERWRGVEVQRRREW